MRMQHGVLSSHMIPIYPYEIVILEFLILYYELCYFVKKIAVDIYHKSSFSRKLVGKK